MDLNGIAKAYQLVYEKKADKDYDKDGKVESGAKEYRGAVHNAIQKKKGGKPDGKDTSNVKKGHDCATSVEHKEYGVGDCIKEMHTLDSAGNVTHYDVMFEHGMEKNVFVGDLNVLVSEMHEHVINTDKNKEVLEGKNELQKLGMKDGDMGEADAKTLKTTRITKLGGKDVDIKVKDGKRVNEDLMSAYYSMYEHHQKDSDGNVIPHEDEEEVKESIDLSFVDELSEEELDTLVEGVVYDLLDEGIEIDAIEGAFTEYLEEAKVTMGHDTPGAPKKPDSKQYDKPVKIKNSDEQMSSDLKKRKEEKAKASVEKAEKIKKSVGKAVDRIKSKPARVSRGLKAKAHSKLADYAGKRKLMPTKAAAAAVKPKKPYMSKKYKQDSQGEVKFRDAKTKYVGDKAKYDKVKDKKQTAGNMKMSMRGSGAKDTRSKLRSVVFKDVKDRIGKKVSSTIKKGRGKVADGITKTTNVLDKIASKVRGEGRELDIFDTVTAYLIDEGLVRDFDHAQRVMTTLDSTLIEEVHAQQLEYLKEYGAPYTVTNADIKGNTPAAQGYKAGKKNALTGEPLYKAAKHLMKK